MDRDDNTDLVCGWWEEAKQTFKENAISIKSRSFYMKDSKRTLRRHASQLKQAAEGSKKITDFFNLQTSSENQSEDSEQSGVESAIKSVEQALENPNLANNVKSRLMAIEMYFRHLDDGRKKVDASELVAISLGWAKIYKGRCIRSWAKQWIQNRTLPESKRGNHPKTKSLWNHEDVAAQIRSYAQFNKVDMTPKKLCEHVNNTILPNIGPYAPRFEDDDLENIINPVLEDGVKMKVLVTHDESTFYSNEDKSMGWKIIGEEPLKKKGKGRAYHVSGFLTETIGLLKLNESQKTSFLTYMNIASNIFNQD
nr:13505_t:CDS:2 [Entrophospora candida]